MDVFQRDFPAWLFQPFLMSLYQASFCFFLAALATSSNSRQTDPTSTFYVVNNPQPCRTTQIMLYASILKLMYTIVSSFNVNLRITIVTKHLQHNARRYNATDEIKYLGRTLNTKWLNVHVPLISFLLLDNEECKMEIPLKSMTFHQCTLLRWIYIKSE